MNNLQSFYRTPTLDMGIALVPTILVYLLEPLLHSFLTSGPLAYGAVTLVIVMTAFSARHAIIEWSYRKAASGSLKPARNDDEQRCKLRQIAKEVSGELQQVRLFNKIVRDELINVIDMTDKAIFDLSEQLLALDITAAKLGHEIPDLPIKTRRCIDRLVDLLIDTQAKIQFHDTARQQIENVIQALRQLDEHTAMLANRLKTWEDASTSCKPIFENMERLYESASVSEQQRSIPGAARDCEDKTQLLSGTEPS